MAIVEHKPERGDPKPLILGLSLLLIVILAVGGVIYWMMGSPKPKTITLSEEQAKQQSPGGPVAAPVAPGPAFPPSPPLPAAPDPGATMVTLDLKEVTIPEAVAALAKAANVQIQGAQRGQPGGFLAMAGAKRITLSVNNQPFWVALRELCKQAQMQPYAGWDQRDNPSIITLQNGMAADLTNPTITAGSTVLVLRSITTRFDANLVATTPPSRSLNVAIALFVEPKLNAYRISPVGVIETAVDENGQSLILPANQNSNSFGGNRPRANWMCEVNCQLNNPPSAGQKIARLKGYVSVATVSDKSETVKIKDPLKLKNQDQKIDVTMIRVVQIRKQGPNNYEGRFQADGTSPLFKDYDNFSKVFKMFDAAGKELKPAGSWYGGGQRNMMEFGLYFNAQDGAGEPAELHVTLPTGIRELRVPFEFTDLPLPH